MSDPVLRRLKTILVRKALSRGRFVLASGAISDYYLDVRRVSLDPEGSLLIAQALCDVLDAEEIVAVGGPVAGAVPIVGAMAAESFRRGRPRPAFMVRKEAKGHGTAKRIDGLFPEGGSVALVEDVVTAGGSVLSAVDAVEDAGGKVTRIVAVVDRDAGGREAIEARGIRYSALFPVAELLAEAPDASAVEGTPYAREWKQPKLTVDVIVESGDGRVLLIRRKNPPPGWAIPGGFVDYGETLEAAAVREIREETGLSVTLTAQFHTYSEPSRDPRHHTVTTVFLGRADGEPQPDDDALEARFFPLDALPEPLAFDHDRVLADFRAYRAQFDS